MSDLISFENITPLPLLGVTDKKSQVWNTTLTLHTSERYLLYAPSGKGKSSFLHILYGLRNDYEGTLNIQGKKSSSMNSDYWSDLRQKHFSIVFQDLRLFPDLTAKENLQVKSILPGSVSEEKMEQWITELQVAHLVNKPAKFLSYGERQRFAIIRALIQPFHMLLLDEPFAHLDPENTRRACAIIDARCHELQAGFIISSLEEDQPLPYQHTLHI